MRDRACSFDFFRFVTFFRNVDPREPKWRKCVKEVYWLCVDLYERNLSVLAIKDRLLEEDSVKFSRTTIYSFLKRHKSCGILTRRRRTVNPASVKLKELHLHLDLWMDKNNELRASELQKRLFETFGLKVSTSLISTRRHSALGWKSQTSNKTCQMISTKNKTVCFSLSLFFPC